MNFSPFTPHLSLNSRPLDKINVKFTFAKPLRDAGFGESGFFEG